MDINIKNYLRESNSLTLIARFEMLYQDETPYKNIYTHVYGGTLNISNANGFRRSFSVNVENTGFDFLVNPQSFWVRQKFKLYLGYDVNGTEYYFPQGIFILDNVVINDNGSDNSVSISGSDKFALLNGELSGRVSSTYKIDVGEYVKDVIRDILIEAGDPQYPILDIGTDVTPYTLSIATGGTYGDMLLSLNGMLSNNMYYDVNGILRCEKEVADIYKECVWDYYSDDKGFHYQGGSQTFNMKDVFNAVKVIGNNVNGNLATGYSENRNPQSYFNIDRLGGVPILAPIIEDSVIPNDTYAQERSDYELKKIMAHFSSVDMQSTPLFFLDVNKIITLTSDNLNLEKERYLINSISMPLENKGGQTSINTVKASDLSFI